MEVNFFQQDVEKLINGNENGLISYQRIYLELLDRQRRLLNDMNHHYEFDEELIRKYLALVDMEEFKIREKLLEGRPAL